MKYSKIGMNRQSKWQHSRLPSLYRFYGFSNVCGFRYWCTHSSTNSNYLQHAGCRTQPPLTSSQDGCCSLKNPIELLWTLTPSGQYKLRLRLYYFHKALSPGFGFRENNCKYLCKHIIRNRAAGTAKDNINKRPPFRRKKTIPFGHGRGFYPQVVIALLTERDREIGGNCVRERKRMLWNLWTLFTLTKSFMTLKSALRQINTV